jgi:hypothetical protein
METGMVTYRVYRILCPFRTRPPVYRIYGRTPLPKALMRYLKSRRS